MTLKKFKNENQKVAEIAYKYYADGNFEKEAELTKKEFEILENTYSELFSSFDLSATYLLEDFCRCSKSQNRNYAKSKTQLRFAKSYAILKISSVLDMKKGLKLLLNPCKCTICVLG